MPTRLILFLAFTLMCTFGCEHKLDDLGQNDHSYRLVYNNSAGGGITIINIDGSNKKSFAGGYFPKWSPREDKIAFYGGHLNEHGLFLVTQNSDGMQRLPLTLAAIPNSAYSTWLDWSPDGKRIVFATNKYSISGGYAVVDADGTNEKNLTPEGFWRKASWSPDGSKIAVEGAPTGHAPTIYIFNLDGTEMYPLINAFAIGPLWSPDGKQINFSVGTLQDTATSFFHFDVYISNPDGSNLRLISDDGNHFISDWSSDGKKFLYAFKPDHLNDFHNTALGLINLDGSDQKTLVNVDENHAVPFGRFSPDGRKIAYIWLSRIPTEDTYSLWVMNVDGSNARKIDSDETGGILEYDWAPN